MTAAGFVLAQSDGGVVGRSDFRLLRLAERQDGRRTERRVCTPRSLTVARAPKRPGCSDTAWVVGHAFTVARRLSGAGGPLEGLGSPSVREPGRLVPWSQWLIEQRIAAGDYRGPADVDGLSDAAWRVVCGLDAGTAEQFFTGLREAAGSWLVQVGIRRSAGPVSFGHGDWEDWGRWRTRTESRARKRERRRWPVVPCGADRGVGHLNANGVRLVARTADGGPSGAVVETAPTMLIIPHVTEEIVIGAVPQAATCSRPARLCTCSSDRIRRRTTRPTSPS